MYDELIIGYTGLRAVPDHNPLAARDFKRTIVCHAVTVGHWRRTLRRDEVVVEATRFGPSGIWPQEDIERAVTRFGRFLERPARLQVS